MLRKSHILIVVLVVLFIMAACNAPASDEPVAEEPGSPGQPAEVTRIVEVPVEVTRVVEVTRLVEVMVTPTKPPATATPEATNTPEAPRVGKSSNPVPVGETMPLTYDDKIHFEMTVTDVIRGDAAWQKVYAANQFNEAPQAGWEYVVFHVVVNYTGEDQGVLELNEGDIGALTKGRVIDYYDMPDWVAGLEPSFDFTLLAGGTADGWSALQVAADDPSPALVLGSAESGVYFALTPTQ